MPCDFCTAESRVLFQCLIPHETMARWGLFAPRCCRMWMRANRSSSMGSIAAGATAAPPGGGRREGRAGCLAAVGHGRVLGLACASRRVVHGASCAFTVGTFELTTALLCHPRRPKLWLPPRPQHVLRSLRQHHEAQCQGVCHLHR